MARQLFFLGEHCLGGRIIPTLADNGKPTNSYALFCPQCAGVWGRMMHEASGFCQPLYSRCRAHATEWSDGTFTVSTSRPFAAREWTEDLPPGVKHHDVASLTNFWINNPNQRWMTVRLS